MDRRRRSLVNSLRTHFRRGCDEGSASMVSYIVAASVFLLGSSYLVHFVVNPPGTGLSSLEHIGARSTTQQMVSVLLDTPGHPKTWSQTHTGVNTVGRLGLIESGTSIRVDPAKFTALARGKTLSTSNANGFVDYAEAKAALGLVGHDFHLRAYPAINTARADYGVVDLANFRVAYVGDLAGLTYGVAAQFEADALDNLALTFTNATRTTNAIGDVYQDDKAVLRQLLFPELGTTVHHDVLSAGTGTAHDLRPVNVSAYRNHLTLNVTAEDVTNAMALSTAAGTIGYTKGREVRAIVGTADLSGLASATLVWAEWVDTNRETGLNYDCSDYGYVEVSIDGGVTWKRLTDTPDDRSQDCNELPSLPHVAKMETREVTLDAATCGCAGEASVLVAFHWVADNDDTTGYGWVVDNVRVTEGTTGNLIFARTFSDATYGMLVIGSDTDHTPFEGAHARNVLRDFVDHHGGRILVLGGNVQHADWLDPLLDVGVGGTAPGTSDTDGSHPFLNVPNALRHETYTKGTPWTFSGDHQGIFDLLIGDSPTQYHLGVSKPATWGAGGGHVIVTSFEPHAWSKDEARRFFANAALNGRYHYLNIDIGPDIPKSDAVASFSRTATMNFRRDGVVDHGEIVFEMHVWPGATASGAAGAATSDAAAPPSLSVGAAEGRTWVNWTPPTSNGTGTIVEYEIHRASSPHAVLASSTPHATIAYPGYASVSHQDTSGLDAGRTYWYTVRLKTTTGPGAPAVPASGTPYELPGVPGVPVPTGGAGNITLTWSAPAQTGPATILGYRIYVNDSPPSNGYHVAGEVGNRTFFSYPAGDESERTFKIEAFNGRGYGPASGVSVPMAPLIPATPPTAFVVTNATVGKLDLAWAAPASLGSGSLTGYKVHRSLDDAVWVTLYTSTNPLNTSYEDFTVAHNARYWYRVQAVTSIGDGVNTSTVDKWTQNPNLPAAHPEPFTATVVLPGRISLAWGLPASMGAGTHTGWAINRSTDGFASVDVQLVQLDETANVTFNDFNIVSGTTYTYRVRALTNVAQGHNSSDQAASSTFTLPTTPANLALANTTPRQLTLTWDSHALGFGDGVPVGIRIYRSTDGSTFPLLATAPAANVTFVDLHVADNTTYWYKIAAASDLGESAPTAAVQKATLSVPWQTLNLRYVSQGVGTVTMAWDAPVSNGGSDLLSYRINVGDSQGQENTLAGTTLAGTQTFTYAGVPGATKWFKVRATNAVGDGPWSTSVQMSTGGGL